MSMVRLAAVLLLLQDVTGSESLPSVRPLRGDLLLWRSSAGKSSALTGETRIAPADRLGSKDGNHASFATEAGSIIALKGVRAAAERGLGLERREGKLFFRVYEGKLAVYTFEETVGVDTPQGLITGKAHFVVEVDKEKGTKVTALDKEVTFTTSMGPVVVGPGMETVAEPGKKPSTPRSVDLRKATEEFDRQEAASNLVKNAGFEDGLKGWEPTQFFSALGKRHTTEDSATAYSGKICIRCDLSNRIQDLKTNPIRFASQAVAVVPGKPYLFRFYYRTDLREGQVAPRMALYNVEPPDTWRLPPEKSWRMWTAVVTPKEKALSLCVEGMPDSERFEGTFWIDEFLLTELPGPARSK